jgi:DNA-binding MarR family transcriptional regulator
VYILAFVDSVESEHFVGCLAGNLRAASRLATRRYDTVLREKGLRITQVAILARVRRRDALSIGELAAALSSERSVIARDVAVLEREGLLSVAVDPKDHRARTIALTKIGRTRLRSAGPAWRRAQQQMREALGDTLASDLLEMTRAVVASLEDE